MSTVLPHFTSEALFPSPFFQHVKHKNKSDASLQGIMETLTHQ